MMGNEQEVVWSLLQLAKVSLRVTFRQKIIPSTSGGRANTFNSEFQVHLSFGNGRLVFFDLFI